MKTQQNQAIMNLNLYYTLGDNVGKKISDGEALSKLSNDSLVVTPHSGSSLTFQYYELIGIEEEDYKVKLYMSTGYNLTLSQLGYNYEVFLTNLYRLRNEQLIKYLLMNEGLRASQIESNFMYNDRSGEVTHGLCEIRLYDSALVVLPQKVKPLRIPYCYISSIKEEDYTVVVETELEERLVFSQMGEKRDYLMRILSEVIEELTSRTKKLLTEVMPQLDFVALNMLTNLMREGKAAEKALIDEDSPGLWLLLESKAKGMGLGDSYDYLKGIAQEERISIGIKRGLSREESKDYIWFLIPIYGVEKPIGNAVALEATTSEGEGRATYFFRLMNCESYRQAKDLPSLNREFEGFLRNVNRCMIEINFRREPIYLSEQQMRDAKYSHYIYAIQEIPSLQILRNLFIGRVVHHNPEQWRTDVESLLKFNAERQDDELKWSK